MLVISEDKVIPEDKGSGIARIQFPTLGKTLVTMTVQMITRCVKG